MLFIRINENMRNEIRKSFLVGSDWNKRINNDCNIDYYKYNNCVYNKSVLLPLFKRDCFFYLQ